MIRNGFFRKARVWMVGVFCGLWLCAGPALAADRLTLDQVRAYLARPHVYMLMRHAYAPGTGDPENFDLQDCFTQRNLDDGGRSQAATTGQELRAAGIVFDKIYTSQWCRCKETARLLKFDARIEELPELNSSWRKEREDAKAHAARLREFFAGRPAEETALYVSHQANILSATGVGLASGQSVLIEYSDGRMTVLGVY